MANLFANSKFEIFQKFPLSHGIAQLQVHLLLSHFHMAAENGVY